MLEPEPGVLDVKQEKADVQQSDTTSSSYIFKNEELLACNLKTEDFTAEYFESNLGPYQEVHVAESKNTLDILNDNVTIVKNEAEDYDKFKWDFNQNPAAGSSSSDGQIFENKMSVVKSELFDRAADPSSAEGVPEAELDNKPYKCELCDYRSNKRGNLKVHMRTHTGEKPYKCEHCDSSFSQSSYWRVHMRSHTGDKPFNCEVCGSGFSARGNLKVHLRSHTGEKPFKCELCDQGFRRREHVKLHLRSHTGAKLFKCQTCGKRFTTGGSLKVHMQSHTGEKPFKCEACDSSFSRRGDFEAHIRSHTGRNRSNANFVTAVFAGVDI